MAEVEGGAHNLSTWERFLRWCRWEWDTPVAVIGGVLTAFAQILSHPWAAGLTIAGCVLLLTGGLGAIVNRKRIARLEDQLCQAELERDAAKDGMATVAQVSKSVYRALLGSIATELGLTSSERISLYLHDAELPTFQLLSRHSPNPLLETAPSRSVYPDHYGLIGQAWRDGWAEDTGLPETVGGPEYVAENLSRYDLPAEVTRALHMKSRALVGVRYPADGVGDRPIGVLIVESLDPNWDVSRVRAKLEGEGVSEMWYTLQEHLRAQRHRLPRLSIAEGLGF